MSTFATRIRKLRLEKGLTQAEMSRVCGITLRNYIRYELGEGLPTRARLDMLAQYFGVTVDYLLGRSDYRDESSKPEAKKGLFGFVSLLFSKDLTKVLLYPASSSQTPLRGIGCMQLRDYATNPDKLLTSALMQIDDETQVSMHGESLINVITYTVPKGGIFTWSKEYSTELTIFAGVIPDACISVDVGNGTLSWTDVDSLTLHTSAQFSNNDFMLIQLIEIAKKALELHSS